jgi:hypothetical protein
MVSRPAAVMPTAGLVQGRPAQLSPHQVVHLQRQHGNQAVVGLLRGPSPRVQRSALDDNTTPVDRNNLRLLTSERVRSFTPKELKEAFTGKDTTEPPADSVIFGSTIDAKLQRGLRTVAGDMVNTKTFTFNTVTNMALDLLPFGGVNGVYRFSLIQRKTATKTAPQTQLIIEQVSSVAPTKLDKKGMKAQEVRFQKFGLQLGTDFAGAEAQEQLYTALARVPDSVLTRIRGVTFSRKLQSVGERGEPGHYDPETHTIEVYSDSLQKLANSTDAGAASFFTMVMAHEIGHAADYEAYTAARLKRDALANELGDAEQAARRVDPNANGLDDRASAAKEKADREKIKKLKGELNTAAEEFYKLSVALETAKSAQKSRGKDFQKAQGNPISDYGKTSVVENFADAMSLYILDPDLLKSLRPKAHEYFTKNFPRR